MFRSMLRRLAGAIAVLAVAFLCLGCSGEEKIPLKKVDFMYEIKPKKPEDLPKNVRGMPGTSAGMKRDPSGMHPGG